MLYVLIRDETSKAQSIKLKVKVEIKGENVRLISWSWIPTDPDPLGCALIGGVRFYLWTVGPCDMCYIKRWGIKARG